MTTANATQYLEEADYHGGEARGRNLATSPRFDFQFRVKVRTAGQQSIGFRLEFAEVVDRICIGKVR